MQPPAENSWTELAAAGAGRLVRHAQALAVLEACMQGPVTLSALCDRLGLGMSTAYRLVGRWVALGAVQVARTEQRAGRAIRHYAATSRQFFVPWEPSNPEAPEDLLRQTLNTRTARQARGLVRAAETLHRRHRSMRWGMVLYADRRGKLVVRTDFEQGRTPDLLDEATPAYVNLHVEGLRLDHAGAKRLQRELVALMKRYKAGSGSGHRQESYALTLMLVPDAGD